MTALACGTAMVARSQRHHYPVIELELLRSRTFSGAFAALILYYAGFGAFVLSAVEFLTGVWHYSAVVADLAIAPGPLMVLPFARIAAQRLAAWLGGPGRVAVLGCAVTPEPSCYGSPASKPSRPTATAWCSSSRSSPPRARRPPSCCPPGRSRHATPLRRAGSRSLAPGGSQ